MFPIPENYALRFADPSPTNSAERVISIVAEDSKSKNDIRVWEAAAQCTVEIVKICCDHEDQEFTITKVFGQGYVGDAKTKLEAEIRATEQAYLSALNRAREHFGFLHLKAGSQGSSGPAAPPVVLGAEPRGSLILPSTQNVAQAQSKDDHKVDAATDAFFTK